MSVEPLHTAICTWSGFVYQGKIALLHAIQVINDEGIQAVANYQLQLDYLDDFAVLDSGAVAKSLHQVKAYKTSYFSSYIDAIEKQKEKQTSVGCSNLFLHTAVEIADKTPASIASEYSPVRLYEYPQQDVSRFYCPLKDVDSEIEARIKGFFLEKFPAEAYRMSEEYLARYRCYLDQIVQEQVIEIHAAVHAGTPQGDAASKKTIPFSQFINVLVSDLNNVLQTEKYFFWKLKLDLGSLFHRFCLEENVIEHSGEEAKLVSYMCQLNGMDIDGMRRFIRFILPHRECKFTNLTEYKNNTFSPEQVCNGFLNTLRNLKKTDKFPFHWITDAHGCFAPTGINEGQSQSTKICERIVRNALDTDLDISFEADKLITTDIEIASVFDAATRILDQKEDAGENYQKINHWKKVALVRLEQAREAIND